MPIADLVVFASRSCRKPKFSMSKLPPPPPSDKPPPGVMSPQGTEAREDSAAPFHIFSPPLTAPPPSLSVRQYPQEQYPMESVRSHSLTTVQHQPPKEITKTPAEVCTTMEPVPVINGRSFCNTSK